MAKILLENIQEEAKNINWKVISTKYINLKTEMEFKCPLNHSVIMTYDKWRKQPICPICAEKSKNNISISSYAKGKNDYRVLALDQSTHVTGWSIYENNKLIKYGLYSVDYESEANRINCVKEWLRNMINMWQIDYVWLEDIQLQDKKETEEYNENIGVTTYKVLARLQGVLINLLYTANIPYNIVHVSTWRKYCNIKGRSRADKKKNAQLQVLEWYGINVSLDEAEAICIGRYGTKQSMKSIELLNWE